jgi:hypothetical protein
MTAKEKADIETKLNQCAGRILGLETVITSLLATNPSVKMDEKLVGKFILEWGLDGEPGASHEDIRSMARRTMHGITSRATEMQIKNSPGERR